MDEKVLKKELIRKEDGRYLYLYSWSKAVPVTDKSAAKKEQGDTELNHSPKRKKEQGQ